MRSAAQLIQSPLEENETDLTFTESIVETVREPLLVLDEDFHIIKANKSFYDTFRVSADETMHRLIYELGNGQWDIPALHDLLERILRENSHFDNFEVEHTLEKIGHRTMLLNARRVVHGGKKILLAIEDITERKRAQHAKFLLASLVESSEDAIITVSLDGNITSWNKAAERIYGYSATEAIGQSPAMLKIVEEKNQLSLHFEKLAWVLYCRELVGCVRLLQNHRRTQSVLCRIN